MVTALIFAGGTGQRMHTRARPKQFLELHGKPVIIHTMEHFQNHPEVDHIVVVCLEAWIPTLHTLLKKYEMTKVIQVVAGGDGGDRSIYNGLKVMSATQSADSMVLIHDAVRPLIDHRLISDNISQVRKKGNAITAEPARESVVQVGNRGNIVAVPRRNAMYVAKAPQSFYFNPIWELYQRAKKDNVRSIDSAHLCSLYGHNLHIVKSSANNLKITEPADYYIFRALYENIENQQILGINEVPQWGG